MDLEPWDPWSELEQARAKAERLVASVLEKLRKALPGEELAFVPATDVVETPTEYRMYLAVPGVVEEDIDLAVEGSWLVVRGERESPFDPQRANRLCSEWSYGFFERRFELPPEVDRDGMVATVDGGVLAIRVPKKQA
jgi:HSP20 family protein